MRSRSPPAKVRTWSCTGCGTKEGSMIVRFDLTSASSERSDESLIGVGFAGRDGSCPESAVVVRRRVWRLPKSAGSISPADPCKLYRKSRAFRDSAVSQRRRCAVKLPESSGRKSTSEVWPRAGFETCRRQSKAKLSIAGSSCADGQARAAICRFPQVSKARGKMDEKERCRSRPQERVAISHPGNCRNNMRRNCSAKFCRKPECDLWAACGRSRSKKLSFPALPPKRWTVQSSIPGDRRSTVRMRREMLRVPLHASTHNLSARNFSEYSPAFRRTGSSPYSSSTGSRQVFRKASTVSSNVEALAPWAE